MTEKKEKETSYEFSWLPFWMAGFMFSVGYGAIPFDLAALLWWERLAYILVSWFLWPLMLGHHLAS